LLEGLDQLGYLLKQADVVAEFEAAKYHQPEDEIDAHWDLTGCVRDMRLAWMLAHRVANAPDIPRWVEGNEFERTWLERHGDMPSP